MGPIALWKLSAALRRRGLRGLAFLVKKVNSAIYHNSLPPGVQFEPDIEFGHHGFGTIIHSNVQIGRRVKIWHNVTIAVRAATGSPHGVVIEVTQWLIDNTADLLFHFDPDRLQVETEFLKHSNGDTLAQSD